MMKVRPAFLFLLLTFIAMGLALLSQNASSAIALHDTFFVMGYSSFFLPAAILSALTSFCYAFMARTGRPVRNRIGYWHFALVTLGLTLTFYAGSLISMAYSAPDPPDTIAFGASKSFLLVALAGPLFLLSGLVIFIYGLLKALRKKLSEN